MMPTVDEQIQVTANPDCAQKRLDEFLGIQGFEKNVNLLSVDQKQALLHVLAYSNFLSNYIRCNPDCIRLIGKELNRPSVEFRTADDLRRYKYTELFKLTARDFINQQPYENILDDTSRLADVIIRQAYTQLSANDAALKDVCILGMGKLGSVELNYSSDIDLIFIASNPPENSNAIVEKQIRFVQQFSRTMESVTSDGFLYRVDLKLRPWGRSGPLILSIDDTENYYSASTEAWERFIWLRARPVAGQESLGRDLLNRLEAFVYRKSLSDEDLNRFLEIKSDMQRHHKKEQNWNVKQGKGGIRDIEFFIQLLQIVNAYSHNDLKITNTLSVLNVLTDKGFIQYEDAQQIRQSYLFLRRLENHLQMIDERQTHQLPEDRKKRLSIARSMTSLVNDVDALELFEEQLAHHQAVAKNCFERILPDRYLIRNEARVWMKQ